MAVQLKKESNMPATSHAVRLATRHGNGALDASALKEFRKDFLGNKQYTLVQNAVTSVGVDELAMDRSLINTMEHSFSHLLDDWEVTNQKNSGRCWMFAGLNLLRVGAMRKMGLKGFEFSQNYTMFWDKFERANYMLEAVIETADRPVDDRVVAHLLGDFANDGGQWDMFVNIIRKHGLVPKTAMPETESSSNTQRMNSIMRMKLREGARDLRALAAKGAKGGAAEVQKRKKEILGVIYRILCIHLGNPPERFLWQWNDKDRKFHRDGEMTPKAFAAKYVTLPVDDYMCLVQDPRPTSAYGKTYTVAYLGNIVGERGVKYLNVEAALMKEIAMKRIMAGEPVWFGCDVGKRMKRDLGLWDARLFDYEGIYDTEFSMNKAERLVYHESVASHAMLFTGVDVAGGAPRRWRVENSWGDANGKKGFFLMNDSWFDEHVLSIAAPRSALPAKYQKACDLEPVVLPPWDPMGALARD